MNNVVFLIPIAAIVVAVPTMFLFLHSVIKRVIDYKQRQAELLAGQTAEKAAQYASHVEKLEARMRVLERIATDKGADLAAEIEDLRDDKLNLGAQQ